MDLLTGEEMRRLDGLATTEYGIPSLLLMENAGLRIAELVRRRWPGKRVLMLAGCGSNGGDGLVAMRHLRREMPVSLWLAAQPSAYRGDARTNLNILERLGHALQVADNPVAYDHLQRELRSADLVIDALLGTGLLGAVRSPYAEIIRLVNLAQRPVLAVDIPSGVCAGSGRICGEAVRAHLTITFAAPKRGLFLFPGTTYAGEIIVADIGLPEQLLKGHDLQLLTSAEARGLVPERPQDAHKGQSGKVLIIAGSLGMAGAAILAARAALRGGAGLVVAAMPQSIQNTVAGQVPEAITVGLPENKSGLIVVKALRILCPLWSDCQAVAMGPGLDQDKAWLGVLTALLEECPAPVVLDAEALNILARHPHALSKRTAPTVLTPHPGEAARLLGQTSLLVQADRLGSVELLANRYRSIAVLKGAHTLIATPQGKASLNATGNSGMATAGSGDVLTGLLGSLLAQQLPPFDAAKLAVYLHGLAGDLAAARLGESGLIATDIAEFLPQAYTRTLRAT